MSKTHDVKAVNEGRGGAKVVVGGRVELAADEPAGDVMDAGERLTRELARVRAKFGLDPAVPRRELADAWLSPTVIEEDEAEFIDALADCLGAGLPLDAALTCWNNGALLADENGEDDDPTDVLTPVIEPIRPDSRVHPVGARRHLVR